MTCGNACACKENTLPDKLEPPTEITVLSLTPAKNKPSTEASDGSFAGYYQLPSDAKELQDLIAFKNMNAQIGEIFKKCYRYGKASHSNQLREAKSILYYAMKEVERLEKYSA